MTKDDIKDEKKKDKVITLADVMAKLEEISKSLETFKSSGSAVAEKPKTEVNEKKHKLGKDEKENLKAELLKGVPYTKEQLTEMRFQKLKTLGSALNVKTFGLSCKDCITNILRGQGRLAKAGEKKDDKK